MVLLPMASRRQHANCPALRLCLARLLLQTPLAGGVARRGAGGKSCLFSYRVGICLGPPSPGDRIRAWCAICRAACACGSCGSVLAATSIALSGPLCGLLPKWERKPGRRSIASAVTLQARGVHRSSGGRAMRLEEAQNPAGQIIVPAASPWRMLTPALPGASLVASGPALVQAVLSRD